MIGMVDEVRVVFRRWVNRTMMNPILSPGNQLRNQNQSLVLDQGQPFRIWHDLWRNLWSTVAHLRSQRQSSAEMNRLLRSKQMKVNNCIQNSIPDQPIGLDLPLLWLQRRCNGRCKVLLGIIEIWNLNGVFPWSGMGDLSIVTGLHCCQHLLQLPHPPFHPGVPLLELVDPPLPLNVHLL